MPVFCDGEAFGIGCLFAQSATVFICQRPKTLNLHSLKDTATISPQQSF
ncbi:hypothetical protein Z949_3826 [Sulfitobacter guttiformis KCTC 32187]|nr:hypothetical protein Z949_3826 [Sulfitobacter guttiformis KCTC 32187]